MLTYLIHFIIMGAFIGTVYLMKLQIHREKKDWIKSLVIAFDAVLVEFIISYVLGQLSGLVTSTGATLAFAIVTAVLCYVVFCFANMLLAASIEYTKMNYVLMGIAGACLIGLIVVQVKESQAMNTFIADLQASGATTYEESEVNALLAPYSRWALIFSVVPSIIYDVLAILDRREQMRLHPEIEEERKRWRK